ncbi:MAG: DUF4114 domain-containing protein [Pseudomonadota bacterium]|nr:DUF4114 domain-containing protein [Pseudomonadota bacterium]
MTFRNTAFMTGALLAFSATSALASIPEVLPGTFNQTIPQDVIDLVDSVFHESVVIDPIYIDPTRNANLHLTSASDVVISFIDEGASYLNTIGYAAWSPGQLDGYTHGGLDTNNARGVSTYELSTGAGVEVGLLFPNASKVGEGGLLEMGDSIKLAGGKIFPAETRISIFLIQDAWDSSYDRVNGWGPSESYGPVAISPQTMYTLDFLNPENPDSATLGNPGDNTRHVAMLFEDNDHDALLMGFEDLNKVDPSSNPGNLIDDEDYNDVILRLQAPMGGDVPTAPAPLAGGGLAGLLALTSMIGAAYRKRKGIAN